RGDERAAGDVRARANARVVPLPDPADQQRRVGDAAGLAATQRAERDGPADRGVPRRGGAVQGPVAAGTPFGGGPAERHRRELVPPRGISRGALALPGQPGPADAPAQGRSLRAGEGVDPRRGHRAAGGVVNQAPTRTTYGQSQSRSSVSSMSWAWLGSLIRSVVPPSFAMRSRKRSSTASSATLSCRARRISLIMS